MSAAKGKRERNGVEFDVDEFLKATEAQQTSLDSVILGIDEAGRGPALGDMVYAGAIISLREHGRIGETGATDSKQLTEKQRESIREQLSKVPTLVPIEKPVTPQDISDAMYSRNGRNLNTLSHETAIRIIEDATMLARGKLCAVYVDTVGPPESYQRLLQGRFPHLNITVAKKADSKFPIVSAASIFAKTTRDRSIAALAEKHGELGSGYPADPKTVEFLRTHAHRFYGFTDEYSFVRQSWGPVAAIAKNKACVSMEWQHELDALPARQQAAQRKLADVTNEKERRVKRDMVYSNMLGLQHVASVNDILAA